MAKQSGQWDGGGEIHIIYVLFGVGTYVWLPKVVTKSPCLATSNNSRYYVFTRMIKN